MDNLDSSVGALQTRYLPKRTISKTRKRTAAHRFRLAARAHAIAHKDQPNDQLCQVLGIPCTDENVWAFPQPDQIHQLRGRPNPSSRLNHLTRDLAHFDAISNASLWTGGKPKRLHRGDEDYESIALARSGIPLPSDRARRPSLERENAFCDVKTYKGRGGVKTLAAHVVEDAQVAELYRMGLLYEDGDTIDPSYPMNLNSLPHDQPVYTIRPAKRSRKTKGKGTPTPLNLDLSFADLGNDENIARYLSSSQTSPDAEDVLENASRGRNSPPLRVIYELTNSKPSFDLDTSQPPDLMEDDYDCFSDSELDDGPSQREVPEGDAVMTSGAWVLLGDDS